uniref:Transporter n=1 Tax=Leptinotarsa decemlineata TaxID=7539 RepID=X2D3Q6_LEPDE|nr:nutrient amino acid transporter [Leptinotarsa decemlineata]
MNKEQMNGNIEGNTKNEVEEITVYDNPSYMRDTNEVEIQQKAEKEIENDNAVKGVPQDRPQWGRSIEFLMSCVAMNVGLGNIWRFPFVAYENGGGAFVIPYLLVLTFFGRPMYYLEMCLGQFTSRGNVKMFESLAPILKGIGYGQLIGDFSVATYYCTLMAISLFYLIQSFTSDLPWTECRDEWKTNPFLQGKTCVSSKSVNVSNNISVCSSELYFRIEVLRESPDISEGLGIPDWRLALYLLASWIVTFLICSKGVKSSGKVSYFLALFPYIILFSLLIRATTLEGSVEGIAFFFLPQWEKLLEAKVWYAAITQCMFSLNIGFGTVTMCASYNSFRHNTYRDAIIVSILDTGTSMLAGTIIFGILGNLALKLNVDIDKVVTSGTGLAFISYPEAIARFESVPWVFAVLFFSMLFILGVGSLIALYGSASTVIMDSYPHLNISYVSFGTAVVGFIIGLVYITPGGQWIFTMVDFYAGTAIFFFMNTSEIIIIAWWYGIEDICKDIEFMLGRKTGIYWRMSWGLIIPVALLAVMVYFLSNLEPLRYADHIYPITVEAGGYALFAFGVLQPFFWFFIELCKRKRKERLYSEVLESMLSHESWGPKDMTENTAWREFKQEARMKRVSKRRNCLVDKLCVLIGY